MLSLYWFDGPGPGRIGVMPRPEEEEIPGLREAGVTTLVSLLEPREIELYGQEREAVLCAEHEIEFLHFPIRDHTAPQDLSTASAFVRGLLRRYRDGGGVMVHCLAGIGRSPTIAGATLLELGLPLRDVLSRMTRARGYPVPEAPEQLAWLKAYRGGPG